MSSIIKLPITVNQYIAIEEMASMRSMQKGRSTFKLVASILLEDFGLRYQIPGIINPDDWGAITGTEEQINWLLLHI